MIGALEVRRELRVEVDDPVGVRLELVAVGLEVPVVGHPLAEHREHVHALGGELLVERGGDHAVDERPLGGLAAHVRVLERLLRVAGREAELDRAGVVLLLLLAGIGDEVRELATSRR